MRGRAPRTSTTALNPPLSPPNLPTPPTGRAGRILFRLLGPPPLQWRECKDILLVASADPAYSSQSPLRELADRRGMGPATCPGHFFGRYQRVSRRALDVPKSTRMTHSGRWAHPFSGESS